MYEYNDENIFLNLLRTDPCHFCLTLLFQKFCLGWRDFVVLCKEGQKPIIIYRSTRCPLIGIQIEFIIIAVVVRRIVNTGKKNYKLSCTVTIINADLVILLQSHSRLTYIMLKLTTGVYILFPNLWSNIFIKTYNLIFDLSCSLTKPDMVTMLLCRVI